MNRLLSASFIGLMSAFCVAGICFIVAETLVDATTYQSLVWLSKGLFLMLTPPIAIITGIMSAASAAKYEFVQASGK